MFRTAFGLRSLPTQTSAQSGTAWTNTWLRRVLNDAKTGTRERHQSSHQQIRRLHLQYFRGPSRTSTSRPGLNFARLQRRGFHFSGWRRSATQNGAQEKLSLSQRLKRLSKEYGWSALGVYLAISVLDFPCCFLLVRFVGTDNIGKAERYVMSSVSQFIPEGVRQKWHEYWHSNKETAIETLGKDVVDKTEMVGWGVEEAQKHHREEASLATQLALAYAIHKSFIFFRVPLTAAVTPRIVKTLRSWGWNIGKRASP
ncbi:hypothetical protein E4U13_001180 [Claviceps humidiphila]|uniref:DUF1279 domain-containing protein n=1 Tax=Claviceps humidiphila TaxID=1294629 RepID=A0A9P7Q389_9HYPO|nr:hypothetical protein E4U13_001180 [Claviceps humidiphila]